MASTPPTILLTHVATALDAAGLALPPHGVRRLATFLHILLRENPRLNLTRITTEADAIARHVVEPLVGWHLLRDRIPPGPLFDAGSGGGAPGLPIAIAEPDRRVILIEARRRKAHYLTETVEALGLANVQVLPERVETVARSAARETGAAVVARALAPWPAALELLLPLLTIDGLATLSAGPSIHDQWAAGRAVAAVLGGGEPALHPLRWPGCRWRLFLATVPKQAPTPDRFPRTPRAIRRRPLGAP